MAHYVKCPYCSQTFNVDKEEYVKISARRYAHTACYEKVKTKEKIREDLFNYIKEVHNLDFVSPQIQKQIKEYETEPYNYTDQGILNALKYWYDVKHNDVSKANGRISIVPYIYVEAQNYYSLIEEANSKNKEILERNPVFQKDVIKVKILDPKREVHHRQLFTFLDEEGLNGE